MAKRKRYSVRITEGIYRNVVHAMSFPKIEEAEAAFAFACSLETALPFDVEMCSYNFDTKDKTTSMWDTLRFRKFFTEKNERDIFNSLCGFAMSKIHLQAKALENNEKPYGTVCDWIRDEFTYEKLSLQKQSEIAESVCNYYGITVK